MSEGATVTYSCIQIAAYMGFSEIILLGVDNNFPFGTRLNGEMIYNDVHSHFNNDYKSTVYIPTIDRINLAYESAREYCDTHNIKILNATRGGRLDAFERVDFESLFREKS
jgi:hypothetical protein